MSDKMDIFETHLNEPNGVTRVGNVEYLPGAP